MLMNPDCGDPSADSQESCRCESFLRAVAGSDHLLAFFCQRVCLFLHLRLRTTANAAPAYLFRGSLILRFLILAAHHRAGRNVRDTYRGIRRIYPDCPPGPEEQNVSMRKSLASILTSTSSASGQNRDCDRRGVDSSLLLGRGHALHAMHAALSYFMRRKRRGRLRSGRSLPSCRPRLTPRWKALPLSTSVSRHNGCTYGRLPATKSVASSTTPVPARISRTTFLSRRSGSLSSSRTFNSSSTPPTRDSRILRVLLLRRRASARDRSHR